jgi:hypothetical protein
VTPHWFHVHTKIGQPTELCLQATCFLFFTLIEELDSPPTPMFDEAKEILKPFLLTHVFKLQDVCRRPNPRLFLAMVSKIAN